LRREHTAAYASTVAFAPQGGRTEAKAGLASQPSSTTPGQKSDEPVSPQKPAEDQNAESWNNEPPPGTYRLDEGTIIETVLLNRLDCEFSGPVITQVSTDVYSRAGLELLIPKGSRLLGEARDVSGFDQRASPFCFIG
jgi:type IV secretion system protein VirB10